MSSSAAAAKAEVNKMSPRELTRVTEELIRLSERTEKPKPPEPRKAEKK